MVLPLHTLITGSVIEPIRFWWTIQILEELLHHGARLSCESDLFNEERFGSAILEVSNFPRNSKELVRNHGGIAIDLFENVCITENHREDFYRYSPSRWPDLVGFTQAMKLENAKISAGLRYLIH